MCITPSVDEANAIKVGDPEEEDVFMGALNSKPHLEKVRRYIEYAVEDGGQAREFPVQSSVAMFCAILCKFGGPAWAASDNQLGTP